MASRIKARGCWVRALAHPTRSPTTVVSWKLTYRMANETIYRIYMYDLHTPPTSRRLIPILRQQLI